MELIPADYREILRALVREAGTQQAAAKRLRMHPSQLSDIINRRKDAPVRLLRKLGLKRVIVRADVP